MISNIGQERHGQIIERFRRVTTSFGKEQELLGMKIKYQDDGTAEVFMPGYIDDALATCGCLPITQKSPTPCTVSLSNIDEQTDHSKREEAHQVVGITPRNKGSETDSRC